MWAPAALAALPGLALALLYGAWGWAAACALALLVALALHAPLLAFFARRRGVLFAAWAFVFHQVHLVYSAAAYVWCALRREHRRGPSEAGRRPSEEDAA
jgi:hypothetical protein